LKRIQMKDDWPDSWKLSYQFDLIEIYGEKNKCGHAYQYINRMNKVIDLVKKYAKAGAKILDVAAGQGNFSLNLAELGYKVTWNDIGEELIGYVKLKYERGEVDYHPGNAFNLNIKDEFDIVLITEVIEHVAHPDQFLKMVSTFCRPKGLIIMTTPNGEYFRHHYPRFTRCKDPQSYEGLQFRRDADGHIFFLCAEELNYFEKYADLRVIYRSFFNNFLTSGHLKTNYVLKILPKSYIFAFEKTTAMTKGIISRKINAHMLVVFEKNA